MSGQTGMGEGGSAGEDPSLSEQVATATPQQEDRADAQATQALCFSGGGIRSATFNLGVLQELARNGRLKTFDYLSTVSGGGYIGAWFMAQIARARQQPGSERDAEAAVIGSLARADESGEPAGTRGATGSVDAPLALKWLRDYSNYLSPTWGLSKDALSLASIYLRNLAIHWMILLPVLIAVLLVPRIVHRVLQEPSQHVDWLLWTVIGSALLMAAFSTNGPPAEGEQRSPRINLVWHWVCFLLPLLAIPIGLSALVSTKDGLVALGRALEALSLGFFPAIVVADGFGTRGLAPAGVLSYTAGFAYAGAVLYLCGSLLLLFARSLPWILEKDGDWRFPTPKGFKPKPSAVAGKNFEEWRKRFPLRLTLAIVSGSLIGAFCGLAVAISVAYTSSWGQYPELRTALLPVLFVFAIWLGSVLRVAIATPASNELAREWWARATGATLVGLLVWVVLALIVLWLPLFLLELTMLRTGWAAGTAGFGGFLFAAATAAIGFWSKHGNSLEQHVERWRDRLGKRLTEIAALVTLVGATLVLNLLIGQATSLFAQSRQDSGATAMVYACASSARAKVLGADVNARQAVSCRVGSMLLADMPSRGFSQADIDGARSRFAACCYLDSGKQSLTSERDVCPTGPNSPESGSVDGLAHGGLSVPTVDMPCVLSTEATKQDHPGKQTGSDDNAPQVAPPFNLDAALPWSIRMAIDYRIGLQNMSVPLLLLCLLGMLVFSILMAWRTGANTYSMQSMYANRLVRAYLGASNFSRREVDPQLRFDDSDDMPLHQLKGITPELVINAALNHTRAEPNTLAWQQRKASHFTFTPSFCGSRAAADAYAKPGQSPSGSIATENYSLESESGAAGSLDEGRNPVTLGQAISLSGAAVSPSMGYHSSPAVSAVLALFNLRLGGWALRPGPESAGRIRTFWQQLLDPWCLLLKEFSSSVGTRGRFVYLSDGGHFENLGVYSMLERRCRFILAVDAGADPAYEFADLENLIRKARVDLGVQVEITEAQACMKAIREGRLRYLHARIHYPVGPNAEHDGSTEGELVLLKPVLCGDEPFDVQRYAETVAKRGSRFPQQSTADQFFDESQFESYRILGMHSVRCVLGKGGGRPLTPVQTVPGPQAFGAAQSSPENAASAASAVGMTGASGWMSGAVDAVNSLGSMGQAALLASAIGVIGVTGVVTLKDPTVSIDQASLEELRNIRMAFNEESLSQLKGLNWKVSLSGAGQVNLGVSELGAQLTEGLKQIDWSDVLQSPAWRNLREQFPLIRNEIALRLQNPDDPAIRVLMENPSTGAVDQDLLDRLDRMTRALIDAASSVQGSTRDLDGVVSRLRDAVDELFRAVEAGNPRDILSALKLIEEALRRIDARVDEISPRNTVRASR